MLIFNFTQYGINDLKRIYKKAITENIKLYGPCKNFKKLLVEVKYSYGEGTSGRNVRGTAWITIRIPRSKPNKKHIVIIFDHELMHVRGYRHEDETLKKCLTFEQIKWIHNYKLRKRIGRPPGQKHKTKRKTKK